MIALYNKLSIEFSAPVLYRIVLYCIGIAQIRLTHFTLHIHAYTQQQIDTSFTISR